MWRLIAGIICLLLPLSVHANEVCVSIDETVDSLDPQQRKSVLLVARGAFGKLKVKVINSPCDNEYKLAAGQLGRAWIATVSGPRGTQKRKSESVEELAEVYDQLIRSIWLGADADDNASSAITRANVDRRQQFPRRVRDDRLFTLALGGAWIQGVQVDEVPIYAMLQRSHELDRFSLDYGLSLAFTYGDDDSGGKDSEGGTRLGGHLGGKYFLDAMSNSSPYLGGALTASYAVTEVDDTTFTGGGLGTRLALGYSIGRASTIRGFIELFAEVPFYSQEYSSFNGDDDSNADKDKTVYAPIYGLVIGVSLTTHRYGFAGAY